MTNTRLIIFLLIIVVMNINVIFIQDRLFNIEKELKTHKCGCNKNKKGLE